MEETAVGGDDHRRTVQDPGQGQEVVEEIDPVHVHQVGAAQRRKHRRRQRIARGTAEWQAHDRHALVGIARREPLLRPGKDPVQGHHFDLVAALLQMPPRDIQHDLFHAAHGRMELAHHVDHLH